MLKRSKVILAASAMLLVGTGNAGAALATGGGASFDSVPAYRTYMYSDATHTTLVGTIEPECRIQPGFGPYVQYHQEGQYTYFQEDELVFYCGPYGPEPL